MTDRWNLIVSKENFAKQMPKTSEMIKMDDDDDSKRKEIIEKNYSRRKRNFGELQRNNTAAKSLVSPLKTLSSDSEKMLKMKIENISKLGGEKQLASLKTNITSDAMQSKYESMKILASEALERFLYLDEKISDFDQNLNGAIYPCK
jgi:hypothetical protein